MYSVGLVSSHFSVFQSVHSVSFVHSAVIGEFLHLIRKFIPPDCYSIPPALPNLVSYAIRGCPLQSYLNPINKNQSAQFTNEPVKQNFQCSHCDEIHHNGKITKQPHSSNASTLRSSWSDVNATENVTKQFIQDNGSRQISNLSIDGITSVGNSCKTLLCSSNVVFNA